MRSGPRWLVLVLAAVVWVVGLGACGGGGKEKAKPLPGTVKTTKFHRFDPETIDVRFDRETTFVLENDDDVAHNFTLTYVFTDPDNFVSVDVAPKKTAEVRFTVKDRPQGGTLTFYCRFHQGEGMSGKLRVT